MFAKRADATRSFYAALTPDQQKKLDEAQNSRGGREGRGGRHGRHGQDGQGGQGAQNPPDDTGDQ